MKICEIDDIDKTWAKTAGINLDIDADYNEAIDLLKILIELKSPNRTNYWIPKINDIEHNFTSIVSANLADDSSTKDLKRKAKKYIQEIVRLKGFL